MIQVRHLLATFAAAGLALGSVAASAAPVREATPAQGEEIAGVSFVLLAALVAAAAVLVFVVLDDDEDAPTSP